MKLYKETLIFTRLLKKLAGLLALSPDSRISDILWFSLGERDGLQKLAARLFDLSLLWFVMI